MLSHKQIERQLVPLLRPYLTIDNAEVATYRLIRANQNNAIPDTGGYSTIQVINSDYVGQGETGEIVYEEGTGNLVGQQYRQNVNMSVRIQTFDDEAIMRANKLRTELNGAPLLDALMGEGFSFVDVAEVQDLSAIRDTRFEERTSLDIEFNLFEGDLTATEQSATEDIGKAGEPHFFNVDAIDSVVVEASFENYGSDTITEDIPVNDPPYP